MKVDYLFFEKIKFEDRHLHSQLPLGDIDYTLMGFEINSATQRLMLDVLCGTYTIVNALTKKLSDFLKLKVKYLINLFTTHFTYLMSTPAYMERSHRMFDSNQVYIDTGLIISWKTSFSVQKNFGALHNKGVPA